MVREIIRENSAFFDEGKIVLMEEFGREHGTYFSVLSAIAGGKTARDQIEAAVGGPVGGYLTKLERDYDFISKKRPVFERSERKNCLYKIDDNFFRFWFRFIFKYNYLLEVKMFEELRGLVERDYGVFAGIALEGYFKTKFVEERKYSRLGGWWNRKGEMEIDLVCENEFENRLDFFEVKRNATKFDAALLRRKAEEFLTTAGEFTPYEKTFSGLSMTDM